jgi:hypothetical protein
LNQLPYKSMDPSLTAPVSGSASPPVGR